MGLLERSRARAHARRAFVSPVGTRCDPSHTKLLVASNQLYSECGYTAWCDPSDNTCKARGCRRDEYPFGYTSVEHSKWPPLCDEHYFCPDEGSFCVPRQPLDSACQLNRDDQCSTTLEHPEVKCLHNTCTAVNVTIDRPCTFENVIYTFFAPTNTSAGSVISRDNCIAGLFCDSLKSRCAAQKSNGLACGSDKECVSSFCRDSAFIVGVPFDNGQNGVCADPPFHTAQQHATWVYPAVIFVAVSLFATLLFGLFQVHQWLANKERKEEEEYWRSQRAIVAEARAIKETIRSMQDTVTQDSQFRRRQLGRSMDDVTSAQRYDATPAQKYDATSAQQYDVTSAQKYDASPARMYDASPAQKNDASHADMYDASPARMYLASPAQDTAYLMTNLPREVKRSLEAIRASRSNSVKLPSSPLSIGSSPGRQPRQRHARQPPGSDGMGIPLLPMGHGSSEAGQGGITPDLTRQNMPLAY